MSANAKSASSGIRERRQAAGISQQELASRADCSIAMVRLLENGYQPHGGHVLRRIVEALKANEPAGNRLEGEELPMQAAGNGSG